MLEVKLGQVADLLLVVVGELGPLVGWGPLVLEAELGQVAGLLRLVVEGQLVLQEGLEAGCLGLLPLRRHRRHRRVEGGSGCTSPWLVQG